MEVAFGKRERETKVETTNFITSKDKVQWDRNSLSSQSLHLDALTRFWDKRKEQSMVNWLYFFFLNYNLYDFYMFPGLAEQTTQRPPDKQSIKYVQWEKQVGCDARQAGFSAAAGSTLTEAPLFHFQRFRQYPSGACGGATGQRQSGLAWYTSNGKLYFLITFPSLFKRGLPF